MSWHLGKMSTVLGIALLFGGSVKADGFNSTCDFAVHADYLYWKAQTDSLLLTSPLSQFLKETDTGNIIERLRWENESVVQRRTFDYDWKSGFRVGATLSPHCSRFSAIFDWTHQLGSASSGCGTAQADWNLHLDFFDASVGRTLDLAPYFEVRPFLGVRYARLWQKFTSAEELLFIVHPEGPGRLTKSAECNEQHLFRGAGPMLGFDILGRICSQFGVFGTGAISGLVGSSSHRVRDTLVTLTDLDSPFTSIGVDGTFQRKENVQANRWILDLSLGLESRRFCFRCGDVRIKAGWEYHAIFGQKLAYFGQDFVPPLSPPVNAIEEQVDIGFDLGLFDVKRQPPFTGSCGTSLALQGLVISLLIDF